MTSHDTHPTKPVLRPERIRCQAGIAYLEVLIATAIIALTLVPALDALYTGMLGARVYETSTTQHYAVLARMEEVLAEQYGTILAAAAAAGDRATPSSFSDATGTPDRRLVFVGLYDAGDADGDGDPFTVPDADLDGDADVFTGYTDLLWVRVEVEGSTTYLESLSAL